MDKGITRVTRGRKVCKQRIDEQVFYFTHYGNLGQNHPDALMV